MLLYRWRSSISIWLYLKLASSLEKTVASPKLLIALSMENEKPVAGMIIIFGFY